MNGLGHRSVWRGRASVHRRFWRAGKEPDTALFYPRRQAEHSSRDPQPARTLRPIPGSRPNNETQKTGTENVEQREVHPGL